jgi:hypothetical protein
MAARKSSLCEGISASDGSSLRVGANNFDMRTAQRILAGLRAWFELRIDATRQDRENLDMPLARDTWRWSWLRGSPASPRV